MSHLSGNAVIFFETLYRLNRVIQGRHSKRNHHVKTTETQRLATLRSWSVCGSETMTRPSPSTAWKGSRPEFREPHANHFTSLLCKLKEKQRIHHTGPLTSRRHSSSPISHKGTLCQGTRPGSLTEPPQLTRVWIPPQSWPHTLNSSCLRKICVGFCVCVCVVFF